MSPRLHNRKREAAKRRALRKQLTPAEACLWRALNKRQLQGRRFRRQYSIGPFIVDFFCPQEHLVIELDGAAHETLGRAEYDTRREHFLRAHGLRILRFENRQVFEHMEEVLQVIASHFTSA